MTDLEPHTTSPELSRAAGLLRAGRLREAERACRRILAAKPDHARALHLLALVAERAGRKPDAVALLQRAVACAPEEVVREIGIGLRREVSSAALMWKLPSSACRPSIPGAGALPSACWRKA
jgi:tetratricopeptide (TPR) repeat protein